MTYPDAAVQETLTTRLEPAKLDLTSKDPAVVAAYAGRTLRPPASGGNSAPL